MADYYPVLARAVAGLPRNDAQARQQLYARARTIVIDQLHKRDLNDSAPELRREQASLDIAIRRVEAESRSSQIRANVKTAMPPPRERVAIADPQQRAKNTARSLAKILQAVQFDETSEADPQSSSPSAMNGTHHAVVPYENSTAVAVGADRETKVTAELRRAPTSLGAMLFGLAYVVAALTFTGVTYIRCMVWVYQGVIGYPILFAAMAVTLALFVVPPFLLLRKPSALPTIDMLWRFIHSRSRRAL